MKRLCRPRASSPLRSRGAVGVGTEPSQHRHDLRDRRGCRNDVHRDGAGGRHGARQVARRAAPTGCHGSGLCRPDRIGPCRRARERHHPSRHQAGQHRRHARRPRQSARLRSRETDRAGADRSHDHRGRDRAGRCHGHSRLHVARAGGRAAGGCAVRHLFVRRRPLRDARGPAAVQRLHACGRHYVDPARSASAREAHTARRAGRRRRASFNVRSRKIRQRGIRMRPRCGRISPPRTQGSRGRQREAGAGQRSSFRSSSFSWPWPASASGS